MKKKFAVLLAVVVALSAFTVGVMSKGLIEKIEAELRGDFTVVIDGRVQTFRDVNGNKVDPILYNGTTYLPVRAIGELMDKTVYWYQDEKTIELVTPSDEDSLVTDADVIVDGADKNDKANPVNAENLPKAGDNAEITLEEAKAIVLDKAGLREVDVTFTKAKLERDDGRWVYDIDFKTDDAKYDAEVDAVTGNVTEWETEVKSNTINNVMPEKEGIITLEEAKRIALDKAGLTEKDVVFEETKLDYEKGRSVYDIEFRHNRVEYTAEIDAAYGTVLEWERDND